ncbi:hypothetical protein FRX31_016798 [Thalictrum thalictroides]|uniref:Uncharacterized protein n=1 Tax=Thalictrum thalictroides TaxID=46969 RepID=A0A7J6W896_THATH|nr:hypothetical protein FRX31_016798 [Thalictrum thalictroides]
MEKIENQSQPLGICDKLFNFFADNLAVRVLKRVTLGLPETHAVAQHPGLSGPPHETGPAKLAAQEVAKKYIDSVVHVEFEKTLALGNSTPANSFGASTDLKESTAAVGGGTKAQIQESSNVFFSPPTSTNNAQEDQGPQTNLSGLNHGQGKKDQAQVIHDETALSKHQDKPYFEVALQEPKAPEIGPVAPSAPKKTVSIKEGTDEVFMPNPKKNVSKEKLKQSKEPDKDAIVKVPRPLKPILRSATNINEKSDAFIRRRREALRSSSNIETSTTDI